MRPCRRAEGIGSILASMSYSVKWLKGSAHMLHPSTLCVVLHNCQTVHAVHKQQEHDNVCITEVSSSPLHLIVKVFQEATHYS